MEEIKSEDGTWDKKKIVIAVLLVVLILGFGVKKFLIDTHRLDFSKEVKGVSTNSNPSIPNLDLQKILQDKLEEIKKGVSNLNLSDVASSSPQFRKALNDLKSLEQYPKNQAKEMCQKICSSF